MKVSVDWEAQTDLPTTRFSPKKEPSNSPVFVGEHIRSNFFTSSLTHIESLFCSTSLGSNQKIDSFFFYLPERGTNLLSNTCTLKLRASLAPWELISLEDDPASSCRGNLGLFSFRGGIPIWDIQAPLCHSWHPANSQWPTGSGPMILNLFKKKAFAIPGSWQSGLV